MDFIKNLIKGIIIGIGAVAPGVSGGTFAVILGIYEKLTDAVANFYINFRKKLHFLIPIGLGVVIGVLGFSHIMKFLFARHDVFMRFLFIGLMMGTLPAVVRDANKNGFKKIYLLPLVLTCAVSLFAMSFEQTANMTVTHGKPDFILRGLYGVLIGLGTIVPGVSSSFMLMAVGGYEQLLDGIIQMDVLFMIPVMIGFGFSILLFAKLIHFLFTNFYSLTYYSILGFVIGSIVLILPSGIVLTDLFFGLLLFGIGTAFSLNLNKLMA